MVTSSSSNVKPGGWPARARRLIDCGEFMSFSFSLDLGALMYVLEA